MANWKNISNNRHNKQLSQEELLRYLENSLSEPEKYPIEKKIEESAFESDALDGLQQIKNPEQIKKHVSQLNQKLHSQLYAKKHVKEENKLKDLQWLIVAVLILLFICIIGYVLIQMHNGAFKLK